MRRNYMVIAIVAMVFVCLLTGCSAEKSNYNKGVQAQEASNYDEAIDFFTQSGDYEDSKERLIECYYGKGVNAQDEKNYEEAIESFSNTVGYEDSDERVLACQHALDVLSDNTPPVISGIDDKIDITCGTAFNINDYIKEKIKIEDDVTEDISDYSISGDGIYDRGTGVIDTMESGEHNISISAKDEAGNIGETTIILSLNPVVVSADNPNPIIYDGEYATIKLKSFKHGEIWEYSGINGYYAIFDVENKCDEAISVYWSMYTSINDYQVDASYEISSIAPGKKGTMLTYIEDSSIPEEAGNFSQIDSIVCIKKDSDDSSFYRISTTFYTDALQ